MRAELVVAVIAVASLRCGSTPQTGTAVSYIKRSSHPSTTPTKKPPLDLTRSARRVRGHLDNGRSAFQLWSSVQVTRGELFSRMATSFGLGPHDDVIELGHADAARGFTYSAHQMRSRGIPVEGAVYSVTARDGRVVGGAGRLITKLDLPTTPTVSQADALSAAKGAVPATQFAWEQDPSLPTPVGELVYASPDFGAHTPFALTYRFELDVTAPDSDRWRVHVDALTGKVIDAASIAPRVDTPATGNDYLGTLRSFTSQTNADTPPQYVLEESMTRDIRTLAASKFTPGPGIDFKDTDNVWSEAGVRDAVSVHWAAERAWDYLKQRRGQAGLDGKGTQTGAAGITIVIDPDPCSTSRWTGKLVKLCKMSGGSGPDVDLETVAHELGHGANTYSPQKYMDVGIEAQTLNEGFADIFATSVQAFATGSDSDWVLYDKSRAPGQRDLRDPKRFQQPDTYGGAYWQAGTTVDEHTNDGVVNHWFYLLAEGGSGTNDLQQAYAVTGIGRAKAEQIALTAYLWTLPASSDFAIARGVTTEIAEDTFGPGAELDATRAAWDAVGVLDPDATVGRETDPIAGEMGVEAWPTKLSVSVPQCPANKPINKGCDPEVEWRFEVSEDPAFATDVKRLGAQLDLAGTANAVATPNLKPHTIYYWRAKSGRLKAGWSKDWLFIQAFQTSNEQPRELSPANDATGVAPWPLDLSWAEVEGATGYQVQVADDADFTQSLQVDDVDGAIHHTKKLNGKASSTIYWRVRAKGPGGAYGDWSTEYDSKGVAPADPQDPDRPWAASIAVEITCDDRIPEPTGPANGATEPAYATKLTWKDNGADRYDIQVAASPGALDSAVVQHENDNHIIVADDPSTTQYWRVRGVGPAGDEGKWSTTLKSFQTDDAAVTLKTPGGVAYPWPAKFSWDEVKGADEYELQVFDPDHHTVHDARHRFDELPIEIDLEPKDGVFKWDLEAQHQGVDGGKWASGTFTIDDASTPQGTSPIGKVSIDPFQPTFAWKQAIPGATGYEFEIQNADNHASIGDGGIDVPSAVSMTYTGPLEAPKNYRWHIRAHGPNQINGRWSTFYNFETVVKPCNTTTVAGDSRPSTATYSMGKTSGTFKFLYRTYTVSDEIRFYYENKLLWSKCVSTPEADNYLESPWTEVNFWFGGQSSNVTIAVLPNCDPANAQPTTEWAYTIGCPD